VAAADHRPAARGAGGLRPPRLRYDALDAVEQAGLLRATATCSRCTTIWCVPGGLPRGHQRTTPAAALPGPLPRPGRRRRPARLATSSSAASAPKRLPWSAALDSLSYGPPPSSSTDSRRVRLFSAPSERTPTRLSFPSDFSSLLTASCHASAAFPPLSLSLAYSSLPYSGRPSSSLLPSSASLLRRLVTSSRPFLSPCSFCRPPATWLRRCLARPAMTMVPPRSHLRRHGGGRHVRAGRTLGDVMRRPAAARAATSAAGRFGHVRKRAVRRGAPASYRPAPCGLRPPSRNTDLRATLGIAAFHLGDDHVVQDHHTRLAPYAPRVPGILMIVPRAHPAFVRLTGLSGRLGRARRGAAEALDLAQQRQPSRTRFPARLRRCWPRLRDHRDQLRRSTCRRSRPCPSPGSPPAVDDPPLGPRPHRGDPTATLPPPSSR